MPGGMNWCIIRGYELVSGGMNWCIIRGYELVPGGMNWCIIRGYELVPQLLIHQSLFLLPLKTTANGIKVSSVLFQCQSFLSFRFSVVQWTPLYSRNNYFPNELSPLSNGKKNQFFCRSIQAICIPTAFSEDNVTVICTDLKNRHFIIIIILY